MEKESIDDEIKKLELERLEAEKEKLIAEKEEKLLDVERARDIAKLPILLRPQNLQLLIGIGFFSFLIVWVYQPLATRTNEMLKLENQAINLENKFQLDSMDKLLAKVNSETRSKERLETQISKSKDSLKMIADTVKSVRSYNDSLSNALVLAEVRFKTLEEQSKKKIQALEDEAFEERLLLYSQVQEEIATIDKFFANLEDGQANNEQLNSLKQSWNDLRGISTENVNENIATLVSSIEDNKLIGSGVTYQYSSNKSGRFKPSDLNYIIMNYTGGLSTEAAAKWFTNSKARASAHVLIGRNGEVYQIVNFDEIAWHAGVSNWNGLSGLNKYSIGIELVNAGRLQKRGDEYFGTNGAKIEVNEVFYDERSKSYWQSYTPMQLDVTRRICELIVSKYQIQEILGHEEISPGRKTDPGPAFPLSDFRVAQLIN